MAWQDDIRNRSFPARGPLRSGLQLRVLQAGSGHIDEWWRLARVVQPHWVLYRNRTAGTELDLADGRVLPLDPAAAWLLPPWLGYGRRTARVEHLWVHFDVVGLPAAALAELFPAPLRLQPDRRLEAACAALRQRFRTAVRDDLEVLVDAQALALAGFALALGGLAPAARSRLLPAAADDRLRPALERIDADPSAALPNALLARLCGLSLARVALLFRSSTGRSPRQYLIDRRLGLACDLLLAGELGIDAVAAACGFADRFAFTHVFTRRIGRTPAAYRDGQGGTGRREDPLSAPAPPRARCSPRSRDRRRS